MHSLLAFWCNSSIFFSFWLLPLSSIMSVEKFWNEAEKYLIKHFSSYFWTSFLKNVILNLCIHSLNTQVPKLIRKVNSLFMGVVSLMSASRYSHSLLCIPWWVWGSTPLHRYNYHYFITTPIIFKWVSFF